MSIHNMNFRNPIMSANDMINEGIADFYDDRTYYMSTPAKNWSGIYAVMRLKVHYGFGSIDMVQIGIIGKENVFRLAKNVGHNWGDKYDSVRNCYVPRTYADISTYDWQAGILAIQRCVKQGRARAYARNIGLKFWPALIDAPKCNPEAFVVAEQVMSVKHGYWGKNDDGTKNHGGWDSEGHYGHNAHDIAEYWYAAGCKNTPKFRAQVRNGIKAQKGESLREYEDYCRGQRWLDVRTKYLRQYIFSRKAIIALGRLSPELRSAAIMAIPAERVIRIRDLNWDSVKKAQQMLASGNVKVRAALSGLKRAAQILGCDPSERSIVAALTPQYRNAPSKYARRIVLGERPVDLVNGLLTSKEAHMWLSHNNWDFMEAAEWYGVHYGLPNHRSLIVSKWLKHVRDTGRWDALERERIIHMPGHDQPVTYCYLQILDEVQEGDIVTGRDSVQAVFERAAERNGEQHLNKMKGDHRILRQRPQWAMKLGRYAKYLNTPDALVQEGRDLKHCVGGYSHAVENHQSHIVAIRSSHGRSTVELTDGMNLRQHYAECNTTPHKRHAQWLRAFLNRYHSKN